MPSTTRFIRGDIFLVEFIFSEGTAVKVRPAVLLSVQAYNNSRQEVIVAGITSNTASLLVGDYLLISWRGAGLNYPSVVSGILSTIKQDMIGRKLGSLTQTDITHLIRVVQSNLGLTIEPQ